ncbi:hypothetical protein GE061_004537 [Apolygus lucorum]|uniref:Major facilitator superfamily (MFS) profile domain-containing protein n=1 Tax=Apolygus lucorum TaxID=248454 RepID=A0A8S9X101_APOLU|nr:hypothetical protein GE061_004537 [Apolygus lucorum]
MIPENDTCNLKSGLARQVFCGIIVSIISLNSGINQGWLSPMSLRLKADDSPVEKISKEESGFLASFPQYSALVVTPFVSYIGMRFGRKAAFFVILVPHIASGLILTFAPSKIWLYVGRTLGGFRITAINVAEMYVSETVHTSIRGMLMAMCTLQINVGILISYSLGKALDYQAYNSLLAIIPFICTVLLFWVPESPHFLIEKHRKDEAKKAMLWLKNGDCKLADIEIAEIEQTKSCRNETLSIKQIWSDKVTKIALLVGVFTISLQTLSGIHSMTNYAGIIYEESKSILSPDDSSIVTAIILLVASLVNVLLMDRFGRKPLMFVSLAGSAISLMVLTVFLYALMKGADVGNLTFLPVVCLGTFAFMYGIGLAAVPSALTSEMSPTHIRPALNGVVTVASVSISTALLQSFPYIDEYVGLYFVFAISTLSNVIGIFFTWFMVTETKGKSLAQISEELRAR